MEKMFIEVLNLSLIASLFILSVIILRLFLKRAPKTVICFMWALVGIRLIMPFSVESIFSVIPNSRPIPQNITVSSSPTIDSGIDFIDQPVNDFLTNTVESVRVAESSPVANFIDYAAVAWIVGMFLMICYLVWSYVRVIRTVREAAREDRNVWICDAVKTPFILGVFRPRIYLPSNLDEQSKKYVLAHERAHIRRLDHVWKPLGFVLLTVHWFNPLMWVAYITLCRDIEFACDEKVIKALGEDSKKAYSEALLDCSVQPKMITVCPIAFGEVSVKKRIIAVLNYKKPMFWVIVLAVAVSIIVGIMFMTNRPTEKNEPMDTESTEETDNEPSPETDSLPETEYLFETEKPQETKPIIESEEETEEPVTEEIIVLDRERYGVEAVRGPIVKKGSQPTEYTIIKDDSEFERFFDKYNKKYPNTFSDDTKRSLKARCHSNHTSNDWDYNLAAVIAVAVESNTAWRSMFPHVPYISSVVKTKKGFEIYFEINIQTDSLNTGSTSVYFELILLYDFDMAYNSEISINTYLPEGGTVQIETLKGLKYESAFITRYTGEGRVGQYFSTVFDSVDSIARSFDQYDANFDVKSKYYPKTYRELVAKYDEDFFKDNVLIRVFGVRPEKGVYDIEKVEIAGDIMRIVKSDDNVLEHGALDPTGYSSEYYIFIEMPREQYFKYNIEDIDTVTE